MEGDAENSWPRKEEAQQYLQKHKIIELLDNITAQLIYSQPGNPKEYLIEQLEKLIKAKATRLDYPCLFDETNLSSVFGMLDPTGRGFISQEQYLEAMTTLGIQDFDKKPPGADVDKITLDTFIREGKLGLSKSSATFSNER